MDFAEVSIRVVEFFGFKLFTIAGTTISVATIVTVLLVFLATFWLSRLLRAGIDRAFIRRGIRPGTSAAINRLIHYAVMAIGLSMCLQTLGIDLGALFTAGAFFAVALGFAMQNIVQNFVSGVILLVERSIKPGDILQVENRVVQVVGMRIRSTIVLTRDGDEMVVPNSILVQSAVTNYTLQDSTYRIKAKVGVTYGSDMALVERVLTDLGANFPWRIEKQSPQVLLCAFGNNSVDWELALWIEDPWHARRAISDLNRAIWDAFASHRITIAFPQLDVHFDPAINDGFRQIVASPTRDGTK